MKRKNDKDVLKIFGDFEKILHNKPSIEKMYEDVRMMKFKIRPVSGDISLLNMGNTRFIETLWSLGKLDEIFQKEFKKLQPEQQEVFYRLFDDMYQKFQHQLNTINLKPDNPVERAQIFEVEIYKEASLKKKHN
ncbi:hypothetical protein HYW87_03980 [Candidatus Roizmanbacteria bacterium]|nr:hypothetical protein [Candidatus Roizmanbacteria bacterium]